MPTINTLPTNVTAVVQTEENPNSNKIDKLNELLYQWASMSIGSAITGAIGAAIDYKSIHNFVEIGKFTSPFAVVGANIGGTLYGIINIVPHIHADDENIREEAATKLHYWRNVEIGMSIGSAVLPLIAYFHDYEYGLETNTKLMGVAGLTGAFFGSFIGEMFE